MVSCDVSADACGLANFHICGAKANQKQIFSGQRKLRNQPYIRRGGLRQRKWKLGENWFFHTGKQTEATHTLYCWTMAFHLLIHTANNAVICHQGFVTIIIYWPSRRTALLSCFIPGIHVSNELWAKSSFLSYSLFHPLSLTVWKVIPKFTTNTQI